MIMMTEDNDDDGGKEEGGGAKYWCRFEGSHKSFPSDDDTIIL